MLKKTLLAYTIGFAFSPPANADGIEIAAVDFDRETLKSLGVDPKEGANKRGNSSRLTQSFHFFMFEPIFSPVNALN
ncbi:TPA: hypothetical protein JLN07_001065, partial [Escherichia coli]|nr:hypothetical protein [Escherichia coli]